MAGEEANFPFLLGVAGEGATTLPHHRFHFFRAANLGHLSIFFVRHRKDSSVRCYGGDLLGGQGESTYAFEGYLVQPVKQ